MAALVDRLVELREELGLTQAEVAERMGTTQPVIARLEAGGRDPRLSTLERYARIVGAGLELSSAPSSARGRVTALSERLRSRLSGGSESPTTTFREVIQFLDDVRALDGAQFSAQVEQEPLSTGDRRWDALVAAATEWAAVDHGVDPPRWTQAARRRLPAPGWVLSPHKGLHRLIRAETPDEFARHGVYIDGASLVSV